jgi:aryl-alcohol dehydrogenase-like predicted oxidoreductase
MVFNRLFMCTAADRAHSKTDPTTLGRMEYRHLGRSGMVVSALSYGNWITHGGQVEEDAAKACVKAALDEGITTFDTADVYALGKAEEVLGRALHGLRRDSIEIFTKVYWPTGPNPNNRGLSRKHIMESCHASLARLQTDHVDLLQAHRYDYETPLEETMQAFDDLVRQGKVHYIGVSEWTAAQIADALRVADDMGFDRIVSNQPQYSLLWRVIEAEVVPLSEKEGIGQIVWSPLAQGVLTGKYVPGSPPPEGSRATSKDGSEFIGWLLRDEVLEPVQAFAALARAAGHEPAAVGLAWVLQNPNVSSAIIGATRPEQVHENVKALDVELDPELLRAIDEALEPAILRDPAFTTSPDPRP